MYLCCVFLVFDYGLLDQSFAYWFLVLLLCDHLFFYFGTNKGFMKYFLVITCPLVYE